MSATQVLDPHTQWGHHHHHHGSGGAPYYGGPTDAYHHQAYHGEAQYHNEYDYDYGPHPSQQQPPLPPQQQQHPEPQEHQHQEPSPQDEYTQGDPQQGYYYDGYPQEDCYAQPPPPPPPQHHTHHCPPPHHAHHHPSHQQQQQQQQQAPHHHTPPHHSLQPAHYAGPRTPPPQPLQQQPPHPHPRHHAHHEHPNSGNGGKGTPSRGSYNAAGSTPAGAAGASSARKGGGKGGKGSCIAGLSMLQHSGPMIVPVGMEPPQAQQASSNGEASAAAAAGNPEHAHPPAHRRERNSPGRSPPHQPLSRGDRGDRGFGAQQGSYGRKGNKAAAQQQQQQSQSADFVAQQRPPPTTVPHQAEAAAQPPPPPPQQASQPHSNAKQQAVVPTVRELAESVGVEDPAATETEAWRTHVVEVACRLRGSDYYWYNDAVAQQTRVLVSADRGHDLGVVIGCWDAETAQRLNKIPPTNLIKRGHFFVMLRPVPTAVAKEKLLKQASQEQKAVEEANRIVSTLDLSSQIAIKDAVFQHDGRKLTLFYTTDSAYYKHYGPLLQPLWNVFRCRIWLHRLANKEEEPAETNDAADEF